MWGYTKAPEAAGHRRKQKTKCMHKWTVGPVCGTPPAGFQAPCAEEVAGQFEAGREECYHEIMPVCWSEIDFVTTIRSCTSAYRYQLYVFCGRHVRLEWARKLGLKSFDLGGPYDKALDAVCERLGVS